MSLKPIFHSDGKIYGMRLASDRDVPAVRLLVNQAYRELADLGLNYTATFQDEDITRRRMAEGRTFLLNDSDLIVGTIHLREGNLSSGAGCAYLGQFGILPAYKRQKLGTMMMDYLEELAAMEGYTAIQLDTAKPAAHLVSFYTKRDYRIIDETRFEGKTYESWIFEKTLIERPKPLKFTEAVL